MKLYCLSGDASKPCFVLSFKGLMIMLDCGLSAQSILNFLPLPPVPSTWLDGLPTYIPPHVNDPELQGELKECHGRVFVDSMPEFCPPLDKVIDLSQVDMILISNYTCMLALPYITEETGFKGQVYASEPTLQIGRFYMEELCEFVEEGGSKNGVAKKWKELVHLLPPPLANAARPRAWRRLYTRAVAKKALARVRSVGYEERVTLYGGVTATPVASGYCLGSANWVVNAGDSRVAYVSGSSTLTTHPRPINQAALRGADVLLLAALTQTPAHNPDMMLGDLCLHASGTLRAGGSLLLPVYPSGVLFDLLECLSAHLENTGLGHVPLYVVSPVADASLAFSNILAEWVSGVKQQKVYLPEEPFPHGSLLKSGKLRHARRLHDDTFSAEFKQPCVVFCGHPSLRFGAAVHLVELWANNPLHAIIFTEPDFFYLDALAPFQPLAMKAFHCPIDTSLNFSQANKLVRELRPKLLALPEQYAPPPGLNTAAGANVTGGRWVCGGENGIVVVKRGGSVSCRTAGVSRPGEMSEALADSIPAQNGPVPISAALTRRDQQLFIELCPLAGGEHTWGAPDVTALVRAAQREGLGAARLEARPDGCIVHLPRQDALLHVDEHATHVFCERGHTRSAIRRALQAAAPPAPQTMQPVNDIA